VNLLIFAQIIMKGVLTCSNVHVLIADVGARVTLLVSHQ